MTREERSEQTKDFYRALATEIDSHLANGSEFIFLDGLEDASAEVVRLRVKILKQEVARLRKLGGSR